VWGPLVAAVVLALASAPVALGVAAAAAGHLAAARTWLASALAVQCGYLAWQLHDLADQLDRVPWTRNAYSSITYTLLAADHVHVAAGIVLSAWLLLRLSRGLTPYRLRAAQAIGWYWHFVAVATLVVTAVVLSGRA
jgi:heme/copper-type cytochrome/quinol oxidase subunit 3